MRSRNHAGWVSRCQWVGRQPGVGGFHRQQVVGILDAQAAQALLAGRAELGVEVAVGAVQQVIPFAVDEQRRLRPHLLEEQRLAPAVVGEDHVGHEALFITQAGAPPSSRHGRG